MKTTRILLVAMISALMFGSCVKENQTDKTEKTGDVPIDIMIAGSDYVETRGTAATTENIEGTFKIYAYEKTSGGVFSAHAMSGNGVTATLNTPGPSRDAELTGGPYNWPADNGLDFYAVYPESWAKTTDGAVLSGTPKVTTEPHTVNTSMSSQTDILYAYNTGTAKGSSVGLEFQHALTKVTFQGQVTNNASANMAGAQITQIKIVNAVQSGVFTFTNASDGNWTPSGTETFTASELTHGINTDAPTTYTDPFFLIPTTSLSGITLEVTVKWTGNSTGTTFKDISLADTGMPTSWDIGKWVNYKLTLNAGKETIDVGAVTVKPWGTDGEPDDTGTVPIN